MALLDEATLKIGTVSFYHAPVGTAVPASFTAPGVAWENFGHTSLEDILNMEVEGGEATNLGSVQNKTLRVSYSSRTESFTFQLLQFDEDSLKFFYGSNMPTVGDMLGVPVDPTPVQSALLVVFTDGAKHFALYAPKAELFRADAISLSDTESLVALPVKATILQHGTNPYTYLVTPILGE